MKRFRTVLLGLAASLTLLTPSVPAQTNVEAPGTVYIIPIEGMIEPALLYVIRRGVAEAEEVGAKAIIFSMDTLGGRLDAATEIVTLLQKITVPTYTFVRKNAISAGAIIALATDQIYMAPASVIGDAMPIMMSPTGGAQEMPDDLQEKSVSAVAALIRAAAQESGHDPKLAEKMVRREIEYRIGDEIISPTNQLLTLTNVEAERMVGPEGEKRPLLSRGTVKDIDALLVVIGREGATRKEMTVTTAERIARYIAALAPLFLMAGLLGIYVEVKTPGFGLPGALGILALALFFWGHHIAGLSGMEEVLIFMLGLILVILEVFFFHTAGIAGLVGGMLMLWALLTAMIQQLPGGPWLPSMPDLQFPLAKLSAGVVMAAAFGSMIARFLPNTPMFNHIALNTSVSAAKGYTSSTSDTSLLGAEGVALMPLRPSGSAQFGDKRLDVVSRGDFVQAGDKVRVVEVHGSRIVVEDAQAR